LLYSVLSLRIPQFLQSGPKSIDDIAQETNINRDKLERVLLALETEKLFNYDWNSRQWSLNETSELFLNDNYVNYIKFNLSPMFYEGYSVLSECLKTGKTAPEIKFNSTFLDFLSSKHEYLKDF